MKRMILFLSTGIKHIDFVLFIGFVKMDRRAKKIFLKQTCVRVAIRK